LHSASIFKLQDQTKKLKGGNHQGDMSKLRKDITGLAAVKEQNEQKDQNMNVGEKPQRKTSNTTNVFDLLS